MKECNTNAEVMKFDMGALWFEIMCTLGDVRNWFRHVMPPVFAVLAIVGIVWAVTGYAVGNHFANACGSITAFVGLFGLIMSQAGRH